MVDVRIECPCQAAAGGRGAVLRGVWHAISSAMRWRVVSGLRSVVRVAIVPGKVSS
jgi:hypothetical protein